MEGTELMYGDPTMAAMTSGQGVMNPMMELISGGFGIVILALGVLMLVSRWRIFSKAKLPGWGAIIPIYNVYLMFKLAGKPAWTWWLLLPPVAGVLAIVAQFKIAEKFGKGTGFAVGLWLLPIIFYPILAFSDAQYQGEK